MRISPGSRLSLRAVADRLRAIAHPDDWVASGGHDLDRGRMLRHAARYSALNCPEMGPDRVSRSSR